MGGRRFSKSDYLCSLRKYSYGRRKMSTLFYIPTLRYFLLITIWLESTQVHSIIWFRPRNAMGTYGLYDGGTYFIPWDDYYHNPNQVRNWPSMEKPPRLSPYVNGSLYYVPSGAISPDFRIPEPPHIGQYQYYHEASIYYRIQPTHLYWWWYYRGSEQPQQMHCYCVMVYKKFTPLAMGAVITYRNILTSALATDIVLSKYHYKKTLENILGAWYNDDLLWNGYTNNSRYMTPARIVYHDRWSGPEMVNRSHPIPCVFDIALWTSTFRFYYHYSYYYYPEVRGTYLGYGYITALCNRWSNAYGGNWSPHLERPLYTIVGCQMVWDIGRKPFPWFKYAVRHHSGGGMIVYPCPKTDWEWFFCSESGGPVLKLGVEPGAALHAIENENSWRYKGCAGLASFSMKLRSKNMVSYFTVLDRHPVLDWLYHATKARTPYAYLDSRFEVTYDQPISIKQSGGQWVNTWHRSPDEWYYIYTPAWGTASFQAKYEPIWWR